MIQTQRLLLRPLNMEDAQAMYAYAKNPIIGKMAGWKPHESIEETKSILETLMKLPHEYAIVYQGVMVGTIGLTISKEVNVGYALSEDYWHRGIMHEALTAIITYLFNKTPHMIIKATTYIDNVKSQNVLLKAGFTYMGIEDQLIGEHYNKVKVYQLHKESYERQALLWQNTIIKK